MTAEQPHPVRTWLTLHELAGYLRDLLRDGDEDDALRFLVDGVNRLSEVEPDQVEAFLAEPPPLGDVRWDTMLAAAVAHVCRSAAITPPRWTRRDTLPQWWWPGQVHARRAWVVQRTPVDFRRVGIWFDARNFTGA